MKLPALALILLVPLAAAPAPVDPLVCAPEVRRASKADDVLFQDLLAAPGGVATADQIAFPKGSPGRHVSLIQVVVGYTGKSRGLERWTVAHASGETASFLVVLIPDGQGGTTFQIRRDTGARSSASGAQAPAGAAPGPGGGPVRITFMGTEYGWTGTRGLQRSFTPKGPEGPESWTDRIVVSPDPRVTTPDDLLRVANAIMEVLQRSKATIVTAHSVPRAGDTPTSKPRCFFLAGILGSAGSVEADFTRFDLVDGKGLVVNYQHRLSGAGVGEAMGEWIKANGRLVERELLTSEQFGASGALAGSP